MTLDEARDAYVLPRDESERSSYYPPEGRILDSATGTGNWALDIANEVASSVEIHAVDVSGVNFPPSPPSNVHLTISSATKLPDHWSNSFDFVNQRLLFAALLREQWPEALSEMYRVLKPGGSVQLLELDLFHPVPESPVVSHYRDMHAASLSAVGLLYDAAKKLSTMLGEVGFTDVMTVTKPTPVGKKWDEKGLQGAKAYREAFGNWRISSKSRLH
ncbi:S-adenosyl-L-methionine-dependent methyltransferase [Schizopora paradoxa]|uniref:S-adenosyl-L-methionine-dependent methyltransferase n=1 Tax=Schizopora paradoxa TaxID=27342 RepID=A0A0H2RP16_9AGAM|nr:S-adenosyl-L-methionine-dependent methyltransferase [Schizopora paradoxa]